MNERLTEVTVPVMMGTKDPEFPDPTAEAKFIAAKTNGRTDFIEVAGHYPQSEMPDKTGRVILDFLKDDTKEPEALKL